MLSWTNIEECLAELNVPVEPGALERGKVDVVHRVLELLTCDCLDVTREELLEAPAHASIAPDNPKLHGGALALLRYVRGLYVPACFRRLSRL